jgi:hypothetical protein
MRIQAFLTASAYNVRKLALRKRTGPQAGVEAQEKGEVTGLLSPSVFIPDLASPPS